MKTYYYRDTNGTIPSDDGKVMYSVITGKQINVFFSMPENKTRRFIKASSEEDTNEIWFEIDLDQNPEARKHERHQQYLNDVLRKTSIKTVSLESASPSESDEDEHKLNEVLSVEGISPEDEFLKNCDIQDLHSAIRRLTKAEQDLVYSFYFQKKPMTVREYSAKTGVPRQTVQNHKMAILKKLKKILSENGTN